jgi:hypothetical protein
MYMVYLKRETIRDFSQHYRPESPKDTEGPFFFRWEEKTANSATLPKQGYEGGWWGLILICV